MNDIVVLESPPVIPDPLKKGGGFVAWFEKWLGRNGEYSVDATVGGEQLTHANISFGADATNRTAQIVPDVANAAKTAKTVIPKVVSLVKGAKNVAPVVVAEGADVAVVATAATADVATAVPLAAAGGDAAAIAAAAASEAGTAAKAISVVGFLAEYSGPIGQSLNAVAGGFEVTAGYKAGDGYRMARGGGQVLGGAAGVAGGLALGASATSAVLASAAMGATFGSALPIVGTIIGAGVAAAITGIGIWLGRKGGEAVAGPALERMMNAKTKEAQDKEIAPAEAIEKRTMNTPAAFKLVNETYRNADKQYQAAIKTTDIAKINAAQKDLDKASKDIGYIVKLSKSDLDALKLHKEALTKDFVNLRAQQIPDSDKEAKAYQKHQLDVLAASINNIAATEEMQKQLPVIQEKVAKAETEHLALTDKRIKQIQEEKATDEQKAYVKKIMPLAATLKQYDDPSVALSEGDVAKIAQVQEKLAQIRKAQAADLNTKGNDYNPAYRKFATQNIKDIDELNASLSARLEPYREQLETVRSGGSSPAMSDTMQSALESAKRATSDLSGSGVRESTPQGGYDPVLDKAKMERIIAAVLPELQRA